MSIKVENSLAGRGSKRKVEWATTKSEERREGSGACRRSGARGQRESTVKPRNRCGNQCEVIAWSAGCALGWLGCWMTKSQPRCCCFGPRATQRQAPSSILAAPALQRFAVTIPARANSDAPRTRPALPSLSCCSLSWTRPPRQRQRSCQRSPTYSCALPPAARWRAAPWLRARAHHRATSNTQERATRSNCTPRH